MKKIIQILFTALFVVAIVSCAKNEIEVVSQDTSYQLDADYVFVDIPQKFGFNPSNILYLSGQTNLTINGISDEETTEILDGNEFTFNVNLKKTLSHDVTVRLVQDKELLKEYSGAQVNYKDFPEDTYSLSTATIKAGEKTGTIVMTLKNIDNLNEAPGYLIPLRLEMQSTDGDLQVSTNSYRVFVKLNMLLERNNIDSSGTPIEGTEFNGKSEVTFTSNYLIDRLPVLNDGSTNVAWYNNSDTWLIATFASNETIKGIKIQTNDDSYKFKGVTIYVAENDVFEKHGEFAKDEPVGNGVKTFYIRFKKPVNAKQIKFDSFVRQGGSYRYSDITEISFFK